MAGELNLAALNTSQVYVVGIGIAGQPLALGIGNQNGTPSFVSVVTNSGNPTMWQLAILSSNDNIYKCQIGNLDGHWTWATPGNALPNCVGLVPGDLNTGATIILDSNAGTLSAAFQPGGFMAPIGGPSGFYFALNNNASAALTFFAQH